MLNNLQQTNNVTSMFSGSGLNKFYLRSELSGGEQLWPKSFTPGCLKCTLNLIRCQPHTAR